MNKSHKGYRLIPFPRTRQLMITLGRISRHKHTIYGLLEIDVTRPRRLIEQHQTRTGEAPSFTAFLAACVGHVVEQHQEIQAYRTWRNQLVLFDDVDIQIQVERDLHGQTFPVPHIVRAANRKTVWDIQEEIRAVQAAPLSGHSVKGVRWLSALPSFARQLGFWALLKNPHLLKQFIGTIGVTAIGMFADRGGWGIGLPSLHTFGMVVGGIASRPAFVDGNVEAYEFLSVTLHFDHDLVDGAPATRFAQHLIEVIEGGYGLDKVSRDLEQKSVPGPSQQR